MSRAVVLDLYGEPEVLRMLEHNEPEPEPEFAGVVDAVGAEVQGLAVGARCWAGRC